MLEHLKNGKNLKLKIHYFYKLISESKLMGYICINFMCKISQAVFTISQP